MWSSLFKSFIAFSLIVFASLSHSGDADCFAEQFPNLFPNSAELSARLSESLPLEREMRRNKNLMIDEVYAFRIQCDLYAHFIGHIDEDEGEDSPVSIVLTTQMEKGDRCVMKELEVAVTDMPDLPNRMEKWIHESLAERTAKRLNGICLCLDRNRVRDR